MVDSRAQGNEGGDCCYCFCSQKCLSIYITFRVCRINKNVWRYEKWHYWNAWEIPVLMTFTNLAVLNDLINVVKASFMKLMPTVQNYFN